MNYRGDLSSFYEVILFAESNGTVVNSDVRELLGVRKTRAHSILDKVHKAGYLSYVKDSPARGGRFYRYSLTKRGEEKCLELHQKGF